MTIISYYIILYAFRDPRDVRTLCKTGFFGGNPRQNSKSVQLCFVPDFADICSLNPSIYGFFQLLSIDLLHPQSLTYPLKNGWLEYDPFLLRPGLFSGAMLGVSKNGTPKSSILMGFSITNHPFWGTPILLPGFKTAKITRHARGGDENSLPIEVWIILRLWTVGERETTPFVVAIFGGFMGQLLALSYCDFLLYT